MFSQFRFSFELLERDFWDRVFGMRYQRIPVRRAIDEDLIDPSVSIHVGLRATLFTSGPTHPWPNLRDFGAQKTVSNGVCAKKQIKLWMMAEYILDTVTIGTASAGRRQRGFGAFNPSISRRNQSHKYPSIVNGAKEGPKLETAVRKTIINIHPDASIEQTMAVMVRRTSTVCTLFDILVNVERYDKP